MKRVEDYRQVLLQALSEARRAGLHAEADRLEEAITTACTTSSELVGVQGEAIVRFLSETQGRLPEGARSALEACLEEVGKVWPRLRGPRRKR
jgi:hypothetical protein